MIHRSAVNKQKNSTPEQGSPKEPIAIIGIGCRFPGGANDPETFWQLLTNEIDAITRIPESRVDVAPYFDPTPGTPGKIISHEGGFLDNVDLFDASFFGISPREANYIDPQQRLLLEVAWEALEDAGQIPENLKSSQTGVFVGMWTNDYADKMYRTSDDINLYTTTGGGRYAASGRLSYYFGFQGPSLTLDTACSSSLVCVHLACQSLREGETQLALAGGVNLILEPSVSIGYSRSKMLSPEGRCKFGDASANGYVRSEGVGLVVLKRLTDAIGDGDRIYAVIRGSAVNNDGRSSDLLVAPGLESQIELLHEAYRNANVSPAQVGYVEAHGTGTQVGDPIELQAIGTVLSEGRASDRPCLIGSIKTNIGHTEAASGVAGLIKASLGLRHGAIPASLHFNEPNPKIPWSELSLVMQTKMSPWPKTMNPAIAAVNSFGITGTNAHIVLSEQPETDLGDPKDGTTQDYLLALSAHSTEALVDLAKSYSDFLVDEHAPILADICFTANCRRTHHAERLAVTGKSHQELAEQLSAYLQQQSEEGSLVKRNRVDEQAKVVFVFPGQGGQWLGMGRELLKQSPIFCEVLKQCDQALKPWVDWSILEQLSLDEDAPNCRIDEISVIQPILFAIEIALAAVWQSWGIEPSAVIGHSMGEVASAYIAGALTLEDAAHIICKRSQLMQRTSGQGTMAVVGLTFDEAQKAVRGQEDKLSIAVHNSPRSVVLSGDPKALEALLNELRGREIFCRPVKVDVASHSPQMDPLRPDLVAALEGIRPRTTTIPFYSTVTEAINDGSTLDAEYWGNNLRQPVQFSNTIQKLIETNHSVFIEMSPHPILLTSVQEVAAALSKPVHGFASLRRDQSELSTMLGEFGALYSAGYRVDWNKLFPAEGRVVSLPTYPWQRERFWLEVTPRDFTPAQIGYEPLKHPILGRQLEVAAHDGSTTWEFDLNLRNFPYLYDHKLKGTAILAASNYLEMILASAEVAFDGKPTELTNLEFQRPLVLSSDHTSVPFQLNLSPMEDRSDFAIQIFSRTDHTWMRHMLGNASLTSADHNADAQPVPLEEIQTRCPNELNSEAFYKRLENIDIGIGKGQQNLRQAWYGTGEVLGLLEIKDKSLPVTGSHQLRLTVLDGCFQVSAAIATTFLNEPADALAAKTIYLPTKLDEVQIYREFGSRMWVHAKLRETSDVEAWVEDIWLCDEAGQIAAEFTGLHLKPLESSLELAVSRNIADWFYKIEWEAVPDLNREIRHSTNPGLWLIFADQTQVGEGLAKQLRDHGERCVLVSRGERWDSINHEHFRIRPENPEDMRNLLTAIFDGHAGSCRGIVHLWSLDTPEMSTLDAARLETNQIENCGSAIHLIQGLSEFEWTERPRLWLVTQGAQPVVDLDSTLLSPAQASLWGLGRVLPKEHPEFWGGLIDLDPAEDPKNLATLLHAQVMTPDLEDQLAFRNGQRYAARLRRLPHENLAEKISSFRWRTDGTYLISGGLGEVGLQVANWVVSEGARRLILIGRTSIPRRAEWRDVDPESPVGRKIAAIQSLEARGASVHLAAVDIADEEQLAEFLESFKRENWPPIRGVIHLAGTIEDRLLSRLDTNALRAVLRPKVMGSWLLHRFFNEADCFIMFSSVGALLGQMGQGNYAAANAFLDALAHYRRRQGRSGLSINWGVWEGLGFAASQGGQQALKQLGEQGIRSFAKEDGLAALKMLLGADQNYSQVAVIPVDWSVFLEANNAGSSPPRPFLSGLLLRNEFDAARESSVGNHSQEIAFHEQLLAAMPEQRDQLLKEYVQKQVAQILRMPVSKIATDRALGSFGLDSLMAVELRNRLEADLGLKLSATIVWNYPTIQQLASYLADKLESNSIIVEKTSVEDERPAQSKIGELLADIDNLSDEEVMQSLLRRK